MSFKKHIKGLDALEKKIGYSFRDKSILTKSLTHPSFDNNKFSNMERLEFLGDAVLEIMVSEYLFNRFNDLDEGQLTQMRASLVNTKALSNIFLQLNCKESLQTSKGTKKLDETHKYSIYAGTLEACIGAIFLELGWQESKDFILEIFAHNLASLNSSSELKDAKSRLQEEAQALGIGLPQYQVSSNKEGNLFNCRVKFNDEIFNASDPIKKDAEQKVAELILHKMGKS